MALDLACEELDGRPRWDNFQGFDHSIHPKQKATKPQLTGVKARFYQNNDGNWTMAKLDSRMNEKSKYVYPDEILAGIHQVCEYLSDYFPKDKGMTFHSELYVFDDDGNKQIYRAAPYFQGKPCFHWAEVDCRVTWDDEDETLPAQLMAFVDVRDLPADNDVGMDPGIYALVQRAVPNEDPEEKNMETDLWTAYVKKPLDMNDSFLFAGHTLLNINRINELATLIPDLESENPRAWLRLLRKKYWAEIFADWLNADHERNFEEAQGEEAQGA